MARPETLESGRRMAARCADATDGHVARKAMTRQTGARCPRKLRADRLAGARSAAVDGVLIPILMPSMLPGDPAAGTSGL